MVLTKLTKLTSIKTKKSKEPIVDKKLEPVWKEKKANNGHDFVSLVKKHNQEFMNYMQPVSTYKCVGKQNLINENDRRGCIFKNVCYKISEKRFEYYNPTKRPVFYDKTKGPLWDFGEKFISMSPLWFFRKYFTPKVVSKEYPMIDKSKTDRIELDKLHVYWSRKSFNLTNRYYAKIQFWTFSLGRNFSHLLDYKKI
jgi:hypothetical protein